MIGPEGRIVGVDLTDAMLTQAQHRIENHGWTNIGLVQADAAEFEFPTEVDAILSTYALSQVPECGDVIAHGAAALSCGGRWVVLDLKVPDNAPRRLAQIGIALVRPFASIDEWIMRRPWDAIRAAMQDRLADLIVDRAVLRDRIPRCRVARLQDRSMSLHRGGVHGRRAAVEIARLALTWPCRGPLADGSATYPESEPPGVADSTAALIAAISTSITRRILALRRGPGIPRMRLLRSTSTHIIAPVCPSSIGSNSIPQRAAERPIGPAKARDGARRQPSRTGSGSERTRIFPSPAAPPESRAETEPLRQPNIREPSAPTPTSVRRHRHTPTLRGRCPQLLCGSRI